MINTKNCLWSRQFLILFGGCLILLCHLLSWNATSVEALSSASPLSTSSQQSLRSRKRFINSSSHTTRHSRQFHRPRGGTTYQLSSIAQIRLASTDDYSEMTSTTTTTTTTAATCSEQTKSRFQGQTVLLTGASSGLGRSFALQLAQCGAKRLVLSARTKAGLESVAEECKRIASGGLDVSIVIADLADKEAVAKLGRDSLAVSKGDGIDVLINCGGVSSRSNFVDTALDVDERVMQINFFSGAALAKVAVPGMIEKGKGAIIWISSVQGLVGIPQRTSYAASKFAVQGYCEALRGELASSGVTVHVASPGYIRTNLSTNAVTGDGKAYGKLDPTTASGADPDDVAVTVLDSATKGRNDFTVASTFSASLAIWLRLLCPPLLQWSLVKRFEKAQKKEKEE